MDSGKEAAANVGASARAGMEKTRAAVQGQVDKAAAYTTGHKEAAEINKEAAKVKMQQRVHAAEEEKQRAMRENAAAKEHGSGAGKEEEDRHDGHRPESGHGGE
ncbi:11 kDa late embryogenesis abundant protein-like [Lolium rigidum]|uniref:11 kDa late embryogenesis abundant protein-like n=1 Tax=Lolium rigidum TaxID=89674 RepID=UPI001F5DF3DF|nr:11 kDa late embryogenesis abundant protein-like [Lolium rigidum]